MKLFLIALSVLVLTACGYKPSSHYIKNVFTDAVYVEVKVDVVEPENAPFIKDEMHRLVYTRFHGYIAPKEQATSEIFVNYRGSRYTPIAFVDGYVTRYRVDINVVFRMKTKEGLLLTKRIRSHVESDIQASSYTSSALRVEAIRKGLEKALDEFLGYVSAKGVDMEEKEKTKKEKAKKAI